MTKFANRANLLASGAREVTMEEMDWVSGGATDASELYPIHGFPGTNLFAIIGQLIGPNIDTERLKILTNTFPHYSAIGDQSIGNSGSVVQSGNEVIITANLTNAPSFTGYPTAIVFEGLNNLNISLTGSTLSSFDMAALLMVDIPGMFDMDGDGINDFIEAAIDYVGQQISRAINSDPSHFDREIGAIIYKNAYGEYVAGPLSYGDGTKLTYKVPAGVSHSQIVGLVHNHAINALSTAELPFNFELSRNATLPDGTILLGQDINTANKIGNLTDSPNLFRMYLVDPLGVGHQYNNRDGFNIDRPFDAGPQFPI